ncbi:hypothetical protein V6N13_064902 [Hibiscus sabdariffa]|uniref:Uncharacterized protein n=1 Tax=Hibiscus sabdariffa TaxID=183260 RepID=A0ABR2ECZ3_9ROSI
MVDYEGVLLRCRRLVREVVETRELATPTSTVAGVDQRVPDRVRCWVPPTEGLSMIMIEIRSSLSIVGHIRDILERQWKVTLVSIGRKRNKVTNTMTTLAWKLPFGFHEFVESSSEVRNLVQSEAHV